MKYYKNEKDEVFAFESDGSQDSYITNNLIRMSVAEIEEHLNPPLVPPSQVTMAQARLALYDEKLLGLVDETINLMPIQEQREKAKIQWEFETIVKRDSALVYGLAGGLGLTDEMLDDLFIKASKIK